MNCAHTLRDARAHARLTQRQLAERTGIAQPTIARIESGASIPRVDTFGQLLAACGVGLDTRPGLHDVDMTQIDQLRSLTPAQRLDRSTEVARAITAIPKGALTSRERRRR